jgi:hypothetical protein
VTADRFGDLPDELALAVFLEVVLVLGVAAAMADDLVASLAQRRHDLGAMVVDGAIQEN